MDLMKKQDILQKEAHEVLNKLQLIEKLSKYGKPEIVGSLVLGLMVWPDIDIEIIKKPDKKEVLEIADYLFNQSNIKSVTITNYVDYKKNIRPMGFYIGVKYEDKASSNKWKIDIWFKNPIQEREEMGVEWIRSRLTKDNRKIILEIKNKLVLDPNYGETFTSFDIYKSILEKGVKNLEEFKKYLQESGRKL